jgi:hypothetical protein
MNANMKKCFVIMPISDHPEYPPEHFKRVYHYIIKPACLAAEFEPIRADDIQTTNVIALDIIKNILNCEMAICDLSSRNPNVLYELGIRQAFNLPVTLIKDNTTNRIFDIQGIRDFEYDFSLRADLVETYVPAFAELIKNTYKNRDQEVNSLVSLLGIEPAKQSKKKEISQDTQLILNAISGLNERVQSFEQRDNDLRHIKVRPNFFDFISINAKDRKLGRQLTNKEIEELRPGNEIYFPNYGIGKIESVSQGVPKRFDIGFIDSTLNAEIKESDLVQSVINTKYYNKTDLI